MENVTKAKQISTKKIVALCCGDAGRAFIYGIIASYLMVFFIPSESTSSLPAFIPNAGVVFGIIYGLGIVWDAITDPIVAGMTDRLNHKDGRRIPFMRAAFIPYAVCAVLVFFPPVTGTSAFNAVWVGVFLLLYYTFSTLYFIPYASLQAEVANDPQKRVFLFSINSGMYVLSSALVYCGFSLVEIFENKGIAELTAYRVVFAAFALIGLILMMIPVLAIREKDYVTDYTQCHEPIFKSLKTAFSYKNFIYMTLAYLIMWVAMTFFNSAQVYYVTTLLELSKTYVTYIAAITILLGVASYPLINKLSAKTGKKPLLVFACVVYVLQFIAIWYYKAIISVISPGVFAILIGVVTAVPISITNILPAAAFSDLAQYDYVCTGQKRTGMFLASKSFILKLSDALVVSIASALITLDSVDGKATVAGVRATAIPALIASVICIVFYALYDDKGITAKIREHNLTQEQGEKKMTREQLLKNLRPPEGRVDVILDTDTYNEIDDQFALAYLLKNSDRLNTVGICAAPFFNSRSESPLDGMLKSYEEIFRIIDLCGRNDLRNNVFRGSGEYLPDENTPVKSDAAEFMAKLAGSYSPENPLYIVAIGAITNVASAFLLNPEMAENTVIVWLAGKAHHFGNCEEFNLSQDYAAARVIMKSGTPFVQLPCQGVVDKFFTCRSELEHYYIGKNELATYLAENTISFCERPQKDYPWTKVIWDVTAVAWLLNDSGAFMEDRIEEVRLPNSSHCYEAPTENSAMTYVYRIWRDALFADMTSKITGIRF